MIMMNTKHYYMYDKEDEWIIYPWEEEIDGRE